MKKSQNRKSLKSPKNSKATLDIPEDIPKSVQRAHEFAIESRNSSYSPYSKFKVGAALITEKGKLIGGCNIENASYGGTVCAERVAILKAVSEGESKFQDVVVVTDTKAPAFPCALCLQVMAEFLKPESRIWIANLKEIHSVHKFSELLPHPFGPTQLKNAK